MTYRLVPASDNDEAWLESLRRREIQMLPSHQNLGIGGQVLRDTISRAHEQHRAVLLSVGLKNKRAFELYQRLGFQKVGSDDTHNHMSCEPQEE